MGYRIVKDRKAWWPVEWKGVDDDGQIITNRIELRYRLLKVDEAFAVAKAVDSAREVEQTADASERLATLYTDIVLQMADNWRQVEAENGDPLPFSAETVRLLMNEPGLFGHVFSAFGDCINARDEVRAGN